jgi:predicted nucleotidyltransferase
MKRNEVILSLKDHRNEMAEQFAVQYLSFFGAVTSNQTKHGIEVDPLVELDRLIDFVKPFVSLNRLGLLFAHPFIPRTPKCLKEQIRLKVLVEALNVL